MSVKLTEEQLQTALAALRAVPKEQIRNIGRLRFYPNGHVAVVAKDPSLIGKPSTVVEMEHESGDLNGSLDRFPGKKQFISKRAVRKANRKIQRIQEGKQRISIWGKETFDALVIQYNDMLARLGQPTPHQMSQMQTLYDNLTRRHTAIDDKFDRGVGARKLVVTSTGSKSTSSTRRDSWPAFQRSSGALVPVTLNTPSGGEYMGGVYPADLIPPILPGSVLTQSVLQVQVRPLAGTARVWLFASTSIPTAAITAARSFTWLNWGLTNPNTNMLLNTSLATGRTFNQTFTNPQPLDPVTINTRRGLVRGGVFFNSGFVLVSDAPVSIVFNWNLLYLGPLPWQNALHQGR